MHEQYGPIIRINPYELHIDDLEYYDELYAGSTRKRENDLLPPQEKTVNRLADDGNILIGAGGETTAQTLAVLFYHLLENPRILSTVRNEISTVDEDITWVKLEKLPFLLAVITETLRISSVVTTRLPRVAPDENLKFKQWTIPAGTPISMSYYLIHYSPIIFPSPEEFDPTRWIANSALGDSAPGNAVRNHRLGKYFVPFSKGTRICLGVNLAYAELFLTTAYILKRFDFELFGTTKKDVEIKRDHFVAAPAAGSKGIRVIVTSDRGE
ncbi:hypothetical protein DID88_003720 [Monilinia fructigena]|uniref:Cytochrome P450 n=1 Tax=Monilinia fructigena TaxID=38457 RepID=A0A395ITN5_9HELO|nr:hypothetical protein DID88_003720 [Monilinia fructigena]